MASASGELQYLCWYDSEFTNLNPSEDLLLQVGMIITDIDLKEQERYSSFLHHDEETVVDAMSRDDWWDKRPEHRSFMLGRVACGQSADAVDQQLTTIVDRYFPGKVTIAGNSPMTDRLFAERFLPRLAARLDYKMLDVSGIALWVQARRGIKMEKKHGHEAISDIEESIEELRYLHQMTLGDVDPLEA